MKRVNQMRIYRLGRISQLGTIEAGDDHATFFERTFSVSEQLRSFVEDDEYKRGLPQAVEKATALRRLILEIYKGRKVIGNDDIEALHFLLLRFETSLNDELQRLHTYMVEPVGAYSFDRLIGSAETVFPIELRETVIPEQAQLDFTSAGRCLAFGLPTACGFHVFRATDAMLRKYCDHFGAVLKGSGRDWGRYIQALRDVLGDPRAIKKPNIRTVELLDSIRAVDRNPLVHPELNLDSNGALFVFDLCKNAVSLMLMDIMNSP